MVNQLFLKGELRVQSINVQLEVSTGGPMIRDIPNAHYKDFNLQTKELGKIIWCFWFMCMPGSCNCKESM